MWINTLHKGDSNNNNNNNDNHLTASVLSPGGSGNYA
jgi:hypothetical protein